MFLFTLFATKAFIISAILFLTLIVIFHFLILMMPAKIYYQYFSSARACLKKAFRELRVSVCGRFYPNEGGVAGYGNRMRVKSPAKWGLQIAEMRDCEKKSVNKILL